MPFHKIAIIGCGQIGTSVALAAASAHPDMGIVAYDPIASEQDFLNAFQREDIPTQHIVLTRDAAGIKDAELVILAMPVGKFAEATRVIAPHLSLSTIFTDVGSAKTLSQQRLRQALDISLGLQTPYVPFHILNGNAGSGPATANSNVFKAAGVLVPGQADAFVEKRVEKFWQSLGCTIHKMSAEAHDKILGTISHLEHVVMFSWMQTEMMQGLLSQSNATDAGNWIQAMTRIADASADMWIGTFADNREQILETARHLRHFIVTYSDMCARTAPNIDTTLNTLHLYAQDKKSSRITPFEKSSAENIFACSAFAALLSMTIAANVERIECETGQSIAAIANPSLKDGLGPVALAPQNSLALIQRYHQTIPTMATDFLVHFDQTITMIGQSNVNALWQLIESACNKRLRMTSIFADQPPC